MSSIELRKRLIEKIQNTKDDNILEEIYRLLQIESEDIEVYQLNNDQISAVNEARQQIQKGQFFTDEQSNSQIDEWLSK